MERLNNDALVNIFSYCDRSSLGRLACTCSRFRDIIYEDDSLWVTRAYYLRGSNMVSPEMKKKTKPYMNARERCEVGQRWNYGQGRRRTVADYIRCQPWLCLDYDYLYCSKDRRLAKHNRMNCGDIRGEELVIFPHTDDVFKFVLIGDEVVTASRNGYLGRWRKSSLSRINVIKAHERAIYGIDAKNDFIVSGSRDESVKIWKSSENNIVFQHKIGLGIRSLAVTIMPPDKLIVGTSATKRFHPLHLYDIETAMHISKFGDSFKDGAGIMDIYQESQDTFLCCGYDTTIRLWDVRSPEKHVSEWIEPYDNGIYCVTSDNHITILSGASRNGYVNLWDKRMFLCRKIFRATPHNSAIYSIVFDAAHLFAAYDKGVIQFSFI